MLYLAQEPDEPVGIVDLEHEVVLVDLHEATLELERQRRIRFGQFGVHFFHPVRKAFLQDEKGKNTIEEELSGIRLGLTLARSESTSSAQSAKCFCE